MPAVYTTPEKHPPYRRDAAVAVVLGAERNGLGAVRSLWQKQIRCIVVTHDRDAAAVHSRCATPCLLPFAERDSDDALMHALEQITESRPVLIPTSDIYVDFMLRNRERLAQRFRFCIPDTRIAELLLNKALEVECVRRAGIPVPVTLTDLTIPSDRLLRAIALPLIIKPKTAALEHHLGEKNVIVASPDELQRFLDARRDILPTLLAQEIVPGPDSDLWVCNCTFGQQHQLLGAFTFRRLGTMPAHRGSTSYAISERNAEVIALVKRLGAELRYIGPAMVEFKRHARTGEYIYIELNPRIGMCNYFDTYCGVNNVYLTYLLACEYTELPDYASRQRDKIMYLALVSDLYARVQDGENIGRILWRYLSHAHRRHVGAYFAWNDPWPAMVSLSRHVPGLLAGAMRHLSGRCEQPRAGQ